MLPSRYAWLAREPGPKMLVEALKLYGTLEAPGNRNNPTIIAWAVEVGGTVDDVFKADEIPWCGLFAAVITKRAGKEPPKSPLWALSWANFGNPTDKAALGDVLVFVRKGGGHVGLYVGEDKTHYHVLGGNQADAVTITRIAKSRHYTTRRPLYGNMPGNVSPRYLAAAGTISTNEA